MVINFRIKRYLPEKIHTKPAGYTNGPVSPIIRYNLVNWVGLLRMKAYYF